MKNGTGLKIASGIVVVVLGLLIFILNGFRANTNAALAATVELQEDCVETDKRVIRVESDLRHIKEDVQDIKQDVREIKRAVAPGG